MCRKRSFTWFLFALIWSGGIVVLQQPLYFVCRTRASIKHSKWDVYNINRAETPSLWQSIQRFTCGFSCSCRTTWSILARLRLRVLQDMRLLFRKLKGEQKMLESFSFQLTTTSCSPRLNEAFSWFSAAHIHCSQEDSILLHHLISPVLPQLIRKSEHSQFNDLQENKFRPVLLVLTDDHSPKNQEVSMARTLCYEVRNQCSLSDSCRVYWLTSADRGHGCSVKMSTCCCAGRGSRPR